MRKLTLIFGLLVLASLVLAACGGTQPANNVMSNEMNNNENVHMMEDEPASDEMASDTPAWFDYEFVDARTGGTFTINSLKGKVVLFETMAMWCSNCQKQQEIVKDLHTQLGERDDFVSVGINIDPEEDLAMLEAFVNFYEFDWLYSVAPDEVLANMARTLGPQYLNAPSTPMAIIDQDGGIHTLPFGIKSVDELLTNLDLYLN
jgi:cytochrome oxidase Cu insertion factor (SCO1/SenC/PrrC family)